MSTKHFFPSTEGVVKLALHNISSRNPQVELDEENRVIFLKSHPPSNVTIISGGGSGHEPAWSGFVGDGMLSAAVCGDVFASPSTKQIMSAIRNVPSDNGILLMITNYTGDRLHFGLAREKGVALGYKIAQIPMAEDAALGRKKAELAVGRRGLAGNLLVLKLVGAASERGWSFDDVFKIGSQGNDQLVTVGTSLDYCHIMGRKHHEPVAADACVVGMGIHNEPGLRTISPQPSPENVVKEMLLYLLDPSDKDRAFVKFEEKDEIVLLINNFGGLSNLECDAMSAITHQQLEKDWKISPCRIYSGVFETSLNGPGFSITLGNISGMGRAINKSVEEVLELLDAPTTAPAWPKNNYKRPDEQKAKWAQERQKATTTTSNGNALAKDGPKTPDSLLSCLKVACTKAVEAEPDITKFDIQMGDGDCGEAVEQVCKNILNILNGSPSSSLFELLDHIGDAVEDVGGSLGAILSIMLTAFMNELANVYKSSTSSFTLDPPTVGKAAGPALKTLMSYTNARVGDRTVMDTLIPFCESLEKDGKLEQAVQAGVKGGDATRGMKAKFGRATYVSESAGGDAPPDPGAYAAAVWLQGALEGLRK